jgi:hypothetical protein
VIGPFGIREREYKNFHYQLQQRLIHVLVVHPSLIQCHGMAVLAHMHCLQTRLSQRLPQRSDTNLRLSRRLFIALSIGGVLPDFFDRVVVFLWIRRTWLALP